MVWIEGFEPERFGVEELKRTGRILPRMEAAENDYRIVRRKMWRDSHDGTYRAARFAQQELSGDGNICLVEADQHDRIRPVKTAEYVEICPAEVARGDGEIRTTTAIEYGEVAPTGAVEHGNICPAGSVERGRIRQAGSIEHGRIRQAGSIEHDRIRPAGSVQRELSCMARFARYA